MRVVSVFGTRPEAIKMAPVVKALEAAEGIDSRVCLTGQHREMLEQVVRLFDLTPDHNLDVMQAAQGLTHVTSAVLSGLGPVFEEMKPDVVLVHGDTTTTMAAAMAAFYQQIPVGHVEAGLRTGNIYSPWPEEMNRKRKRLAPISRAKESPPTKSRSLETPSSTRSIGFAIIGLPLRMQKCRPRSHS